MRYAQIRHCTIAAATFCLLFAGTGDGAARVDYDTLSARGLQLLKNGSFEELARGGKSVADWGAPKDIRDRFKVVTDATGSRHGASYVTFAPGKLRYLYGSLKATPSGKLHMSAWVKGEGQVYFIVTVRAKDWRVKKVAILKRLTSGWFTVEGNKWRCFSHVFDVPESFEVAGKREEAGQIGVQFGIKGSVSLDECTVAAVEKLKQVAARPVAPVTSPARLRPSITIPKLSTPPTVDGEIDADEWRGAAAVTGFNQLSKRKLASRQTVAYVGFDDRKLYVGFRCLHEGKFGAGKPGRDSGCNFQTEGIEIWLQPPGKPWYQFLGWPAGGIIDVCKEGGFGWNGRWQFKNKVEDSGETVGGILLFSKKTWTAEVSVPFEDLGVTAPKDGETWRVNFCRDFSVSKGKTRQSDDWTTWAPLAGRFQNVKEFGDATFRSDSPGVQMTKLGDLTNGDLSVSGAAAGRGGKVRIEARAAASGSSKTLSFQSKELAVEKGRAVPFALSDTLKVSGAIDIDLDIRAEDAESGQQIARVVIPFTATAALRLRLIPAIFQDTVYAQIDAGRVPDLPKQVRIEAEIFKSNAGTGISASEVWTSEKPSGDLKLEIGGLAPGDCQVKAFLKDTRDGKTLASSVASFPLVEKPEWFGNKIGVTDVVPTPWTPVRVEADRVAVTEREYRLAPIGLPRQISALGEELFASPPKLIAEVGGREIAWECESLEQTGRKPGQVVWRLEGQAGSLELQGTLTVEFDGLALWEFTVQGKEPVVIDSLRMEFPFKSHRSLYARGANATEYAGAYLACLYDTAAPSVPDICSVHFSSNGWAWPEQWVHRIWIGDDERGLSIMCETQANLRGKRRTVVEKRGQANTLVLYLVDGPRELKEPLRYRYAWQATPVKPQPKNPKLWHATYRRVEEDDYLKRVFVTTDYHALKYISYPMLYGRRRAADKRNAIYREHGVKLVPYFATQGITTESEDLKPFLREWERYPVRTIGGLRGDWVLACLQDPAFADFIVWSTKKIVDDFGYDGLYLDVSSVHSCSNHYHGCGCAVPGQAERQPTVNIFASRAVYKRLYCLLKSEGRDRVLFRHGMPVAAVAGFVDVVTQGEDWCREGMNQYDRLTPDIFRAKCMRIQYGTPYTWYTFHHYYRGIKFGGRIPLDTILAYCLPHRVLPTEGRAGMWPVWDVTDQFWTSSKFIPYWATDSPVQIDQSNVLGSIYWKEAERKALLVVANWNKEPRTVDVKLDLAKLGMAPDKTSVRRALDHPIRQREDPPVTQPMPNNPVELTAGRIRLWLAGRNLELVLLESK